MFTSGKPGFLASEDLVLFACGLRRVKVIDDGFGVLELQRGADNAAHTISITAHKPDGTLYGPVNATWVAATTVWKLTVPVADYMAGVWFFRVVNTSEMSTLEEYVAVEWGGVYGALCVNALGAAVDAATASTNATTAAAQSTTAATQSTNAAADALAAKNNAANAKTSADTAGTKADAAKASADTAGTKADAAKTSADTAGTKADAAKASADLALAQATTAATQSTTAATQATTAATQSTTAATQATTAATQATLARQAGVNRLRIDFAARTQILYADDGTTPLKTFALKDEDGVATATRIFERGAPT